MAFILFYFLEHHLLIHAGHEERHHTHLSVDDCGDGCCTHPHPLGMVAFFGMALHSAIVGMIIGTGFEVSHDLGLLAPLGVIAHEVPEGIAMLAILLHYGWPRRTAIELTSFVAVATPAAALISYAVVRDLSPQLLGALLAMAGGSFVYIAASDLSPNPIAAAACRRALPWLPASSRTTTGQPAPSARSLRRTWGSAEAPGAPT